MTVETSMTVATFGHVINGTCESPAGRLSVLVDPVTDNVYARAAVGSADDVDRACRSSEKAARSWRRSTPARRQELLLALNRDMKPEQSPVQGLLHVRTRSAGKGHHLTLRPDALAMEPDGVTWFEVDRSARGSDRAASLNENAPLLSR